MKNFRNVLLLTGLLIVIVFAWLIPKTKGEKKTQYVRVYTEEREVPIEEDSSRASKTSIEKQTESTEKKKTKKERVVIQKDTLTGKIRMKDIKMSLYSRSMHFVPEELKGLPAEAEPFALEERADSAVVVK